MVMAGNGFCAANYTSGEVVRFGDRGEFEVERFPGGASKTYAKGPVRETMRSMFKIQVICAVEILAPGLSTLGFFFIFSVNTTPTWLLIFASCCVASSLCTCGDFQGLFVDPDHDLSEEHISKILHFLERKAWWSKDPDCLKLRSRWQQQDTNVGRAASSSNSTERTAGLLQDSLNVPLLEEASV